MGLAGKFGQIVGMMEIIGVEMIVHVGQMMTAMKNVFLDLLQL
jgi:hypothetical protein